MYKNLWPSDRLFCLDLCSSKISLEKTLTSGGSYHPRVRSWWRGIIQPSLRSKPETLNFFVSNPGLPHCCKLRDYYRYSIPLRISSSVPNTKVCQTPPCLLIMMMEEEEEEGDNEPCASLSLGSSDLSDKWMDRLIGDGVIWDCGDMSIVECTGILRRSLSVHSRLLW